MLLGIIPFGVITGVAMVASGIPPLVAMLMSMLVFAGASMVASAQLLASSAPVALVILTTLIINLRFMMYSASLRQHFAHAPLRWRLLLGYLTADNVYGLMLQRFSDRTRTTRQAASISSAPASRSGWSGSWRCSPAC